MDWRDKFYRDALISRLFFKAENTPPTGAYDGMGLPDGEQLLLDSPFTGYPQKPPVTGLRLPQPAPKMDPVGNGVSLADWIKFQGWAPARTDQRPGEPYMGPLPPTPAEMPKGLRDRMLADSEQGAPADPKPKPKPANSKPAAKPRSKDGKPFVVGKLYKNAKGQVFKYLADGSFKKVRP